MSKLGGSDNSGSFEAFRELCQDIGANASYNKKTEIIANFLETFEGDLYLLCKFLICKDDKRAFNVGDKMIVKTLSRIFNEDKDIMMDHLDKGDISETAFYFLKQYKKHKEESAITLQQVDTWLDELCKLTKDDDIYQHFSKIIPYITPEDLKSICRLIDKDLKINIGAKFVLNALHPDAYTAYNNTSNLRDVIDHVVEKSSSSSPLKRQLSLVSGIHNPIKPMLAKPLKNFDDMFKKGSTSYVAEIKYDGERVQVHYDANTGYKFFSRNLKPVKENKVESLDIYFDKSFSKGDVQSFIMDGEVLVIDSETKKMLPFGSLGVHKQKEYPNAQLCYFIFDLLYVNGVSVMDKSYTERRNMVYKIFKPIDGRIEYSESFKVETKEDLDIPWNRVIVENLEGLMIKDISDTYKPNQRHWMKLKRDYLEGMGDTIDLIVLGGYWGKGSKGGKIATFLMGVYDKAEDVYKTVCKVYSGLTDDLIESLQNAFDFIKIDCDPTKVPSWLKVSNSLVPNFVVKDPTESSVWEIKGTSYSVSKSHTADGISVRFPRLVRFRDDKDSTTATNLVELMSMAMMQPDFALQISNLKPNTKPVKAPKTTQTKQVPNKENSIFSHFKPIQGNTTSTTASRKYKTDKGFNYVSGSVVDLMEDDVDIRLVLMFIDESHTWKSSKEFGRIKKDWPKVYSTFNDNTQELELGSALISSITTETPKGKTFVALLRVIDNKTNAISNSELVEALAMVEEFAFDKEIKSIHYSLENQDFKEKFPDSIYSMLSRCKKELHSSIYIYNPEYKPPKPKMIIVDEEGESKNTRPAKRSAPTTDIFSGKKFFLHPSVEDMLNLKCFIYADGGNVVSTPSSDVSYILADKDPSTLEPISVDTQNTVVVRSQWVWDSIKEGTSSLEPSTYMWNKV